MIRKSRRRELIRSAAPRNNEERLHDALLRLLERWDNGAVSEVRPGARLGRVVLDDDEHAYLTELVYGLRAKGAAPKKRWPR